MSEIKIEVVEDVGRSQGGHAIIKLNGVWLLPANSTFRIEPVDELDAVLMPAGWPKGDLTPLETRLTPQGVEIVVGPDVVDCPSLLPGTPVSVSVPSAFVKAEVLWPDLQVSLAANSAPVVMTAAELAAELDAVASLNRQREEAEALLQLKRRMNGSYANGHADHETSSDLSQLRLREDPAGDRAIPGTVPATPKTLDVVAQEPPRLSELEIASTAPLTATALATSNPPTSRALVPAVLKPAAAPRHRFAMGLPFGLGFVVAALLTGLVALRQGGSGAAPPVAGDGLSQAASLSDVFAVAIVSPRGRDAKGVDSAAALKLADETLHGANGAADPQEAAFWLRKSLSLSIGSPQHAWALTQLGTLYAQPTTGAPDYAKARLLWEIAGDNGDAEALCFLGSLHEHGLGIAASKSKALAAYERSKAAGGCRDIDTAIARVRK